MDDEAQKIRLCLYLKQTLEKENFTMNYILRQERSQNKFYRALYSLNEDFRKLLKVKTKSVQVLDYGCGIGNFAQEVSAF